MSDAPVLALLPKYPNAIPARCPSGDVILCVRSFQVVSTAQPEQV